MALDEYRKKRNFKKTPEPSGEQHPPEGRVLHFVVQEHHASHLHFDFRLELDGMLKSWAVPKGMPEKAADKRLAVMVDDHPLEYRHFEGSIPAGSYGAGSVIIWDEGTYRVPGARHAGESEDALRKGLAQGKADIVLEGRRSKGEFTLVRMKRGKGGQWLLIKKKDQPLAELLRGAAPAALPGSVTPMLATLVDEPFDGAEWLFEVKWDGYRAIAQTGRKGVRLYSRNGKDFMPRFPRIAGELGKLSQTTVLDGEIVALDETGRADFQLLQNYRLTGRGRLVYYVFDIVYCEGFDLMPFPLSRRKEILNRVLPPLEEVRLSGFVGESGKDFYRAARENGVEGIVAKHAASPYRPGVRGYEWLKLKAMQRQEAVIGGFTEPQGGRKHFGALVLGVYEGKKLKYIGHAGGGFDDKELAQVRRQLDPLISEASPFEGEFPTNTPVTWVEPRLVCEVKFAGWTRDGCMRQPVFLGLRDDKPPREVVREAAAPVKLRSEGAVAARIKPDTRLSNLDKVFWPGEGITKGDLVRYYQRIAPVLLPYLKDRPEVLHRQPDGIKDNGFVQKNIDMLSTDDRPTVRIANESGEGYTTYLLCQDEDTLAYMVNLGCIEMHPWHSRVQNPAMPDYLVLDFDPLDVSFTVVIETVLAARRILEDAGIESYCKTSGATGLHVYVPLGAKYTYEQAEEFANAVSLLINANLPAETSLARDPARRRHRVYLDYRRNEIAQTAVAAYAVRPRPCAPVSTPLKWSEVNRRLDPAAFTISTIEKRIERAGDLWKGVLGPGIDMERSIRNLQSIYEKMPAAKHPAGV